MIDFKSEQDVMKYYKESDIKCVIFQGTVYNVSEYAKSHPGGSDLIEEYYG